MANYKIAVLGDRDSVLGFKALGLEVFPAENAEEARPVLHQLARGGYAVVYLTEQLAVGGVTNMYDIVEKLTHADLVVKP